MSKIFTVSWFDGNIGKFSNVLNHLRGKDDVHGLEIGSFEGKSSCWFLDNIFFGKNSTLTCVDTWSGSLEHTEDQIKSIWERFCNNVSEYPKNKLIVKRGLSRDILKKLNDNYYDFIYVDGSHTSRDVLEDAVLSFDLLKINGVMTFDDYLWKNFDNDLLNPKTGIDCFLRSYQDKYELIESAYQVTIIKKYN